LGSSINTEFTNWKTKAEALQNINNNSISNAQSAIATKLIETNGALGPDGDINSALEGLTTHEQEKVFIQSITDGIDPINAWSTATNKVDNEMFESYEDDLSKIKTAEEEALKREQSKAYSSLLTDEYTLSED
jgi:hypothetical protein